MNERGIIRELQSLFETDRRDLLRGIGDDCAVIAKDGLHAWLVTMDTLIEGVHFDLGWHPPEKLGQKAVAVNVSDIAAMGGQPAYLFLSLGVPEGFEPAWVRSFGEGIGKACKEYGCVLAGGDTVRTLAGIQVTITAVGEMETDQVVYRNGAKPDDIVWVSGTLGNAAAGLDLSRERSPVPEQFAGLVEAHLNPRPRMELSGALARSRMVNAMIDLSDGLATDLSHICLQSGTGAVIRAADLPASAALEEAGRLLERDPLRWMISGGEDYELLFTTPPAKKAEVEKLAAETEIRLTPVGTIVRDEGVRLLVVDRTEGREIIRDVSFSGFDHFHGHRAE